jgi:hypothetical protein
MAAGLSEQSNVLYRALVELQDGNSFVCVVQMATVLSKHLNVVYRALVELQDWQQFFLCKIFVPKPFVECTFCQSF